MPPGLNYPFPPIPPLKWELPLHTEAQLLCCVSEDRHQEFKKPGHKPQWVRMFTAEKSVLMLSLGFGMFFFFFWGTLTTFVCMPTATPTRWMTAQLSFKLSTKLSQEGWQPTRKQRALWRSERWQCIFLQGPRWTLKKHPHYWENTASFLTSSNAAHLTDASSGRIPPLTCEQWTLRHISKTERTDHL